MISCPSCGSSVSEDKFLRKHFSDIVKCEYKLYHCKSCDLEFWVPLVFIKSIYENEIIEEYSLWHQGEELILSDNHTSFINYLSHQNLVLPKKVLDVGCGSGSFILWFSKKSLKFLLDKVGFEPEIFPVKVEKYMSAERILRYLETIGMKFGKYNFLRSLILLLLRPVSFVIRSVYNISSGLGIMFVGRLKV